MLRLRGGKKNKGRKKAGQAGLKLEASARWSAGKEGKKIVTRLSRGEGRKKAGRTPAGFNNPENRICESELTPIGKRRGRSCSLSVWGRGEELSIPCKKKKRRKKSIRIFRPQLRGIEQERIRFLVVVDERIKEKKSLWLARHTR